MITLTVLAIFALASRWKKIKKFYDKKKQARKEKQQPDEIEKSSTDSDRPSS